MRTFLLASAATLALIVAHPAFAQTTIKDTEPRAAGQQNPAPADVTAPTDPTVPAELQLAPQQPSLDPQNQQRPGRRGGEWLDQSQMPIQEAQNQVPPNQVGSLPGQQAAPHGQASGQQGQAQPTDPGTPINPAAPPGMPTVYAPDQLQSLPGEQAVPHGQGAGQQGQSFPERRGDMQPEAASEPILVAQNDTTPEPSDVPPGKPSASDQAAPRQQGAAQSGSPANASAMINKGYNAGGQEPMSRAASNTDPSNTRSTIAPRLPAPPVGPDATAPQLLHAARAALGRHATGEAQEALERAETRLLDRSTEPSNAGMPDSRDAVRLIGQALQALGHHDMAQATQAIDGALQTPAVMQSASNI